MRFPVVSIAAVFNDTHLQEAGIDTVTDSLCQSRKILCGYQNGPVQFITPVDDGIDFIIDPAGNPGGTEVIEQEDFPVKVLPDRLYFLLISFRLEGLFNLTEQIISVIEDTVVASGHEFP